MAILVLTCRVVLVCIGRHFIPRRQGSVLTYLISRVCSPLVRTPHMRLIRPSHPMHLLPVRVFVFVREEEEKGLQLRIGVPDNLGS